MKAPDVVVEEILAATGDTPCTVIVEDTTEVEVRYACNSTTTNGIRTDRRITVMCFDDNGSVGTVRRAGTSDTKLLVAEAKAARIGPADDAQELARGGIDSDFTAPAGKTDFDALDPILRSLPGIFDRADAAGREMSGFADHHVDTVYLGLSTGLRRRHLQETASVQLVGRSEHRSSWAGIGELGDIEALESRVCRGLDWARQRLEIPVGDYEVLLPPEAVADLMVPVLEAASARQTEEGRTVYSNTRDISPLPFTLRSDPFASGLECSPFVCTSASGADDSVFDNGLDLSPVDWVRDGTVQNLRSHRAGASRHATSPTFGVDNLILELPEATGSLDDMVQRTENGLLLTCLWYIREVDPSTLLLTGLTRDGVYVIRDGVVVGAASNFRFNESPTDLLRRATEAGESTRALGREFGEWMNRTRMPPLRIPDFHMSSVSLAS